MGQKKPLERGLGFEFGEMLDIASCEAVVMEELLEG